MVLMVFSNFNDTVILYGHLGMHMLACASEPQHGHGKDTLNLLQDPNTVQPFPHNDLTTTQYQQ